MTASPNIAAILDKKQSADLQIETLGLFQVTREGQVVSDSEWKRDAALQLFQFFITNRHLRALHKNTIMDRLWGDLNEKSASRNFKAALHSLTKVIEPDRATVDEPKYIIRQGVTYRLDTTHLWLDIDALDELLIFGNQQLNDAPDLAAQAYQAATDLYKGIYLPNRIYDDWCADERERIQVLVLGAMMSLAKLRLDATPNETIRLAQQALHIDSTWEEAYRLQMLAYLKEGNRPLAMRTYQKCVRILKEEFDISPLPETRRVYEEMVG